jgi:hypothetical protein
MSSSKTQQISRRFEVPRLNQESLNQESRNSHYIQILSRLLIASHFCRPRETVALPLQRRHFQDDIDYLGALNATRFAEFVGLANANHVIVRALTLIQEFALQWGDRALAESCAPPLDAERSRISTALEFLENICTAFQSHGYSTAVIKSLDHLPDLGSDLDLCTLADQQQVEEVMQREFKAHRVQQSWGDRLANKWNYSVPGLPELVEIHVQCLGQTGEHSELARRVVGRAVPKAVEGRTFHVAAAEERIIISTLQRVYRHFYFRLCDMIDTMLLFQNASIDFDELEKASRFAGIWQGVTTFLFVVQKYLRSFGGDLSLPEHLISSTNASVQFENDFLRVPKSVGVTLYASQLLQAGSRRDVRSLLRLPLLPPLAVSAWVKHELVGNDKGIW